LDGSNASTAEVAVVAIQDRLAISNLLVDEGLKLFWSRIIRNNACDRVRPRHALKPQCLNTDERQHFEAAAFLRLNRVRLDV
jgi:hypothetical protein